MRKTLTVVAALAATILSAPAAQAWPHEVAGDLLNDGYQIATGTHERWVRVDLGRYLAYAQPSERVRFVVRLNGRPVMVERFSPHDARIESWKRDLHVGHVYEVTVRRDGVLVGETVLVPSTRKES